MDRVSVFGQSLANHFRDQDFILDDQNRWNPGNEATDPRNNPAKRNTAASPQ